MSMIRQYQNINRRKSHPINVGNVKIGDNAPISVQTMTNTLTTDIKSTISQIKRIEEVLFVKNGKVKVTIYNEKQHIIAEEIVSSGDVVYLCHGGHGFEILEKTELIEVKQGPYLSKEEDKICF